MDKPTKNKKIKNRNLAIDYSGQVKIDILNGKKKFKTIKIKNSGTSELFKLLAMLVCGENAKYKVPAYLQLFDITTNRGTMKNLFDDPVLNSSVPVTTKRYYKNTDFEDIDSSLFDIDNTGYIVEYTFLIPGASVSPNSKINVIALFATNSYKTDPLAYITLDPEKYDIEIEEGNNILLTWSMYLQNRPNAEDEE